MDAAKIRRGSVSNEDLKKLNRAIVMTPTPELERRLYAVQAQNPGLFIRALRKAGYRVEVNEREGSVTIHPEDTGVGRPVSMEEFEKL
jgi:hypothetical protein